jgi:hypothetical protein
MNVSYKRSLLTAIMFGLFFFFIVIYFIIIGPDAFLENSIHFAINAIVVAVTLISFAIMLLLTNRRKNIVDERDKNIQIKASSTGLMLTSMYVFILSIVLFIIYRNDGFINVTWMWFLAYSTFAFAYFVTSLLNVYFYLYEE